MLFGKNELGSQFETPIFGTVESNEPIPKYKLAKKSIAPQVAYRLIKDDLLDEGNARQNLATFCQTYMDDEAVKLMSETLEKNAIDKSEYPQTTDMENRCVNILADLWHAPKELNYMGTSTVGSSEACMLGGMAMKFRWRNRAKALGMDVTSKKPNLVISSGYQVCWEKFCVYWDIEMRLVPMDEQHMSINVDKVLDYVDDYTIGVVGILGITYTGKYDDIKALDKKLEEYNKTAKITVPIHVDGASGAMFAPFIEPDLKWDFQLKNVVSISTSGHKYGLVYPGIGWVLWKDKEYLPQELVFEVSYLGGKMPTMAINFSRSASQILGQYYNFLRYGFEGYRQIHQRTKDVAMYLSSELEKTGLFEIYNNGENLPIVCYKLKDDVKVNWTLYDLADRLLMKGWQVPAYPLPEDLQNVIIQRFVCRADLSRNLADLLMRDLKAAIEDLNNARILSKTQVDNKGVQGFTH
ncbi:TPA: glutamate decarboxylase [Clostridium perfringens]|uniref:Glutamate decarboxylase n=1 Tax=Clostridium perfringens (strain SM101 / Type A) TaxID=289380 RepID=Q0SRB9_CLOPS|nr:glutamate decarboxylase [Clostridium perfringens]ABG85385.1 glutamate decarboxylase [Clostridium perfringens SM101]EJT5916019.1 glutamate decarboxylase [Clostridium perfringens]EJT5924359.1 glutamate decarboxylase [Clostridium perfringens]EJT6134468.1 glutamate decarboxylase [Clostridium perfringens]MDG6878506.1 Glutamate decarboxylase [Clostridium perfringens]